MNTVTAGWLESAEMDLDNIELIKDQVHLTPVIAFHCHQAVEKSLKAILEEKHQDVAKTHDLMFLLQKSSQLIHLEMDNEILKRLNELYIDSRYPGELGLLPEGKPSLDSAQEFYAFAKNIHDQIYQALEKANQEEPEDQSESEEE